jgi:flagellar motility protein MotE (MotC chaperone)
MELLPFITLGLTFVLGIISFFIKRELDNKDKEIARLDERLKVLEDRVNKQDVTVEKLNGRIDLVIELLERIEKKLEKDND